jgi:predicted heme/steroid binding protein
MDEPAADKSALPIAIALTVCTFSTALFLWYWQRTAKSEKSSDAKKPEGANTTEIPCVSGDIPTPAAPKDGVFTVESLAKFDGEQLPMCLGICGQVVNVSSSENFKPGQGYGKLWAGKETTYAMAKVSLTPVDANRFDWKLEDFTDQERTALAGWYKHFTTKYPIVGTLKEYDGWDFSAVFEEAKTQTPFGAEGPPQDSSESGAETANPVENAAEATAKDAQEGLVLRPGARVLLKGLTGRAELNGEVGVLKDYIADKGRFAIEIQNGTETVLVKPSNLAEPPPQ